MTGTADDATIAFEPLLATPLEGPLDGPVWFAGALLACRPEANEIVQIDPETGATSRLRHSTSGARGLAVGSDGRLYCAQTASRRIVWMTDAGSTYFLGAMLDGLRHNEPRDLAVDAAGRIWFADDWTDDSVIGPVGFPPLDHCSILRLTRSTESADGIGEWVLERATADTDHPRGVAFDPATGALYVTDRGADSRPATLRRYDTGSALPALGEIIHRFAPDEEPGGLTVVAGRVVVAVGPRAGAAGVAPAGSGAGAIVVVDHDGTASRAPLLADAPTNVTTGPDGRTMYVTTIGGRVLRFLEVEPVG